MYQLSKAEFCANCSKQVIDDDDDLIRQTQKTIDSSLESSPSLLSIGDNYCASKCIRRIRRPDVQEGEAELEGTDGQVDVEHAIDIHAKGDNHSSHALPLLTASPMTTTPSDAIANNIIVVPAPQGPVVSGFLVLSTEHRRTLRVIFGLFQDNIL